MEGFDGGSSKTAIETVGIGPERRERERSPSIEVELDSLPRVWFETLQAAASQLESRVAVARSRCSTARRVTNKK